DWAYPMRREMQEILPGLFLGPYSAAMKSKVRLSKILWQCRINMTEAASLSLSDILKNFILFQLHILEKRGITHIVCIRQDIEANFIKPNFPEEFRYLVLDIADNPVENIIRFFPMTKEFIDGSLHNGGKVLVHGNAGISRSAALVIAYLMETFGVKYRIRTCAFGTAGGAVFTAAAFEPKGTGSNPTSSCSTLEQMVSSDSDSDSEVSESSQESKAFVPMCLGIPDVKQRDDSRVSRGLAEASSSLSSKPLGIVLSESHSSLGSDRNGVPAATDDDDTDCSRPSLSKYSKY
ncbi:hypothetical protein Z043_101067, partial [Scleropages formosus]